MTYASWFSQDWASSDFLKLVGDWDEKAFLAALEDAVASFAPRPDTQKVCVQHVFRKCVTTLREQNKCYKQNPGNGSEVDVLGLETEQLNLSQFHNVELENHTGASSEGPRSSDTHDDGDDITDISTPGATDPKSPMERHADAAKIANGSPAVEHKDETNAYDSTVSLRVFRILTLWFRLLSSEAGVDHALLPLVFSPEVNAQALTVDDLLSLLTETNIFLTFAVQSNDISMAELIKEAIHLLNEILVSIFKAVGLEEKHGTPHTALVLKKLLHCFYLVDIYPVFDTLVQLATSKLIFANDQETAKSILEKSTGQSLRLSYDTLSKVLVCIVALASRPKSLRLEQKASVSLDITTLRSSSSNAYMVALKSFDFSDSKKVAMFESRFIPYLAAEFNFFYELGPDLLQHSLRHSSFFTWITGDALSSSLYLYTHTSRDLTTFENQALDPNDPFLYEVEYFEHTLKLKKFQSGKQDDAYLLCQSYLLISTLFLAFIENPFFVEYLTRTRDLRIPLLNIWLCVSSYVHHYQYKSEVNKQGARVFLLGMLKLTSSSSLFMKQIDGYTINESSWKFCHQKSPIIPIDKENENRPVLFYIMDVLQVTFRFNLSKKLCLTNVKIALTVLYQILDYYQENPNEDLKSYHWKELYLSLTNLLRFISKSQNEERVKFVVEEAFSVFEILLSPVFDKVIVEIQSAVFFGNHLVKAMNYDLLYIMLQQRDLLSAMYRKYIVQADNFTRVGKAFDTFEEKIQAIGTPEIGEHEVEQMISGLSILSDGDNSLVSITLDDFNNLDTFKYLDKFIEDESLELDQNAVVLRILLGNQWTPIKLQ